MFYRCLHSNGWHTYIINAVIEGGIVRCGIVSIGANSNPEISLKTVDGGSFICRLVIPEEFQSCPVRSFVTTEADIIELEIKPVPETKKT